MKIVLVGPEIEENLSLGYLKSALVRAGHDCEIVGFKSSTEIPTVTGVVLRHKPGLIGFSLVAQRRYHDFQCLGERLRHLGFSGHITAGGHFASLRASEILRDTPHLDSILHHDGEERIVALARWLLLGGEPPDELDGVTWRSTDGSLHHRPPRRTAAIDTLPFPARRASHRTSGFVRAPMVTSRGCAGACSFCSIHAWHRQVPAGRLRFRSPDNVVQEMVTLHEERGVTVFIFHDDDFIHPDRKEAVTRCQAILEDAEKRIGAPFAFVIKCRPDNVDEPLFRYLKAKGLVRVYLGIETNSEIGMHTLNRRSGREANEQALAILDRIGVFACFNLLIFHPDSTAEELDENLDFLERHTGLPFDIARTELYARSSLEERMIREGRARGDYRGFDYRICDPLTEATFRLFADVLWERHFGDDSILQRVQDLGYRLSLLRRFYPELSSVDLQCRVTSLIRDVNEDTIGYLRRLAVAARSARARGEKDSCVQLASQMRKEIALRIKRQFRRLAVLSFELEMRSRLGRGGIGAFTFGLEWPRIVGRLATAMPSAALLMIAGSCNESVVCDPPPPPVRFSSEIAPELNQTCAIPGCHSVESDSAHLSLTTDSSYANLVRVPSSQVPRLNRVEPNLPDSSYLMHKLQGTQLSVGGTGARMPKDGQPKLWFIQQVREWITTGAKKD